MHSVRILSLSIAIVLLLSACAQQSPARAQASASPLEGRRATLRCPAGTIMQCETRRTGRIRHGTFARNNDHCACIPEGMRTIDSPVIPGIRQ